ncbi:MAG: ABC transporter substrate-binding protein [Acidimicrobiia bacterium]
MHARLVAGVVGISLFAAACGGGGGDSSADSTTAGTNNGAGITAGAPATTSGATTTAIPKKNLPACPVKALDSVTTPVQITVWHGMNQALEIALQKLTDRYNTSQTKVKVTLANQVGYKETFNKYRTAAAGDRPNVVQIEDVSLQAMIDSQTVIPVQSCIDAENYSTSDYADRVLAYYTVGGALWPMPFNVSNPVLYYNTKAFEKAGLDPTKPPKTLEELRTMSEQLVKSGAVKYGLALDTSTDAGGPWFLEQWFAKAGQFFADNDNGRSGRATKVLFDNDFGNQLISFLQTMVKDGLAVNVGRNPQSIDTLLKLVDKTQPAGMTINTSAALGAVYSIVESGQYPDVGLGVAAMPGPTGDGNVLVGGASMYIVKGKTDQQTAASWDFIKFLTGAQQQAEWSVATGYVPIRKSSVDDPAVKDQWAKRPGFKVPYDQLITGKSTASTVGAILGPNNQIRETLQKALDAIYGGSDVKSTLADAAKTANSALAQYAKDVGN